MTCGEPVLKTPATRAETLACVNGIMGDLFALVRQPRGSISREAILTFDFADARTPKRIGPDVMTEPDDEHALRLVLGAHLLAMARMRELLLAIEDNPPAATGQIAGHQQTRRAK